MDFKIRALRYFTTAVEKGSVTKAAEHLHVSQPTMSLQLRALEELLGFQLLRRSAGGVEPTPEGRLIISEAVAIVQRADRLGRLVQDVAKGLTGNLRLGVPPYTAALPERQQLIEEFMAEHARLRTEIINGNTLELIARMRAGDIDLVLAVGPTPDPDLIRLPIRLIRMGLLMPAGSPLASQQKIDPADLAGLQIAVFRREINPPFYDQVFGPLLQAGAHLVGTPEATSDAIARYARKNLTLAASFEHFLPPHELEAAGLVRCEIADDRCHAELAVVKASAYCPPSGEAFWRFAERRFLG
jgi:DNA-binding transcriptional LysR family regulator